MTLTHGSNADLAKRRDEGAHSDRPSATNPSTKKTSPHNKSSKGQNASKAGKSSVSLIEVTDSATSKAKTTIGNRRSSQTKTATGGSSTGVNPKNVSKSGPGKTDIVLKKLHSARGVTIAQIMEITNWQAHSVRGFLSGVVKTKLGLELVSEIGKDGPRRYRVIEVGDHAAEESQNSKQNSGRGSASGSGADGAATDNSADADSTSQVSDEAASTSVVATQKA